MANTKVKDYWIAYKYQTGSGGPFRRWEPGMAFDKIILRGEAHRVRATSKEKAIARLRAQMPGRIMFAFKVTQIGG